MLVVLKVGGHHVVAFQSLLVKLELSYVLRIEVYLYAILQNSRSQELVLEAGRLIDDDHAAIKLAAVLNLSVFSQLV